MGTIHNKNTPDGVLVDIKFESGSENATFSNISTLSFKKVDITTTT